MLSLCYGLAAIYAVLRVHQEKKLVPISVACYVIGLLGTSYYRIGTKIPFLKLFIDSEYFLSLRRIFFMGFPFLILGWTIFSREKKCENFYRKGFFAASGLIAVGFICEIVFVTALGISRSVEITLFLYPLIFVLFRLCLMFPADSMSGFAQMSRFIASYTYYWHPLVIVCLQRTVFLNNWLLFIVVSLVCLVTGYCTYELGLLLRRILDASKN